MKVQVKVLDKRLGGEFSLPSHATVGSAGWDLRAMTDQAVVLEPGATALVPSGLSVFIQDPQWVGLIMPRSGLGHKKGLVLGNLTGVIDADYQGPLMISLWNRSSVPIEINMGDAVAQFVLVHVTNVEPIFVTEFTEDTVRGGGGFGHTGTR